MPVYCFPERFKFEPSSQSLRHFVIDFMFNRPFVEWFDALKSLNTWFLQLFPSFARQGTLSHYYHSLKYNCIYPCSILNQTVGKPFRPLLVACLQLWYLLQWGLCHLHSIPDVWAGNCWGFWSYVGSVDGILHLHLLFTVSEWMWMNMYGMNTHVTRTGSIWRIALTH